MHNGLEALASIGCTAASSAVTAAILYRGLLTFPEGQAFLRTGTIPETFPSPVSLSPDLSTFDSVCTLFWLASNGWVAWKLLESVRRNAIPKIWERVGPTSSTSFRRQMLLYTGVMVPWSVLRFLPSTLILQVVCLSICSSALLTFRYVYNIRILEHEAPQMKTKTTTTSHSNPLLWVWAARANLALITVYHGVLLWLHYAFRGRFPAGYLFLSLFPHYALSAVTGISTLIRFHLASRKVFWAAFGSVVACTVGCFPAIVFGAMQDAWGLYEKINCFISAACIIDGLVLVPPFIEASTIMDELLPPSTTTECASRAEAVMPKILMISMVVFAVACTEEASKLF